ncbi:dynein beta chain, ciliary-like [Rhincodon typus]|uniref:dynein beta chain, ciliary-like n=1 Tax=Rhincodon typus TaxID=259920 RepID=UPI002030D113|nr:dynein beta chain, ciliary-like [Rhincodon typus]
MAEEGEENHDKSFGEDEKVQYIAGWIIYSLRLRADKWVKFIASKENQKLLSEFLEREYFLVWFLSDTGLLAASRELPSNLKSKVVYVIKKISGPVLKENYRRVLLFGHLSASPLNQITTLVEEISSIYNVLTCEELISENWEESGPDTLESKTGRYECALNPCGAQDWYFIEYT